MAKHKGFNKKQPGCLCMVDIISSYNMVDIEYLLVVYNNISVCSISDMVLSQTVPRMGKKCIS